MRHANVGDYRRRLRERVAAWQLQLKKFSFTDVPGLGDGEIAFASPLTLIVGPNSVGKTTLLRAIWAAADPAGISNTRMNTPSN